MSELSYEELQASVKEMQGYIASLKKQYNAGDEEEKDEDHEASFKKAMDDMEKKDKEHEARKAAFKRAMEEEDPEKKKEAQKIAMDMMDEKKKEAMDDDEKDEEKEARVASLEDEIKQPLIQKILTANQLVNPQGVKKLEQKLKTASLAEVKTRWAEIEPFANVVGVGNAQISTRQQTGIPFNASAVMDTEQTTELHVASSDEEFNQLDSEKLLQEMYR